MAEQSQQRLLKANNVQRRRFEKVADELFARTSTKSRKDIQHAKDVVYNKVVEETMGNDLKVLMKIRGQIQAHKQEIAKIVEAAEKVRTRLVKRGISVPRGGYSNPLNYYIDPPVTDEKQEDVCVRVVGNPHVVLDLMKCDNNAPFAEYKTRIARIVVDEQVYKDACDKLRSDIWAVVSTDEIVAKLDAFRAVWL